MRIMAINSLDDYETGKIAAAQSNDTKYRVAWNIGNEYRAFRKMVDHLNTLHKQYATSITGYRTGNRNSKSWKTS